MEWIRKLLGLCEHEWELFSSEEVIGELGEFCSNYYLRIFECKKCKALKRKYY